MLRGTPLLPRTPLQWLLAATLLAIITLIADGCSEFKAKDDPSQCPGDLCDEVGAAQCTPDGRRFCVETGGCRIWSDATPCVEGERCAGAGVCGVDSCPTLGDIRCVSESQYESCQAGTDGFLHWSGTQGCPTGTLCSPSGGCVDIECATEGARMCEGEGSYRRCELTRSGLTWSSPKACGDGEQCAGEGACGSHACSLELGSCDGTASRRPCLVGPDGFRIFGEPEPCPESTTCAEGVCGAHDCGPKNVAECIGKAAYQTCVPGAGGFLVWSSPTACGELQVCSGEGVCGADGCSPEGAGECTEAGLLRVCETGAGGFRDWSEATACADGTVCAAGACSEHECPAAGALQCASDTQVKKCHESDGGLRVWLPAVDCPGSGTKCKSQGVCGKDACVAKGDTKCDGVSAVLECTQTPSDFLTWGPPTACSAGLTCQKGECGADACILGETSCDGSSGVLTCEAGAAGFLELAEAVPCPKDTACVGSGTCAPTNEVELWDGPALGRPSIARLGGGGFAAAWATSQVGAFNVRLRRFSPAGEPLEEAADVSGPVGVTLPYPSLVALPAAGENAVAIAWLSPSDGKFRVRRSTAPGESDPIVVIAPLGVLPSSPQPTLVPADVGLAALLRIEGPSGGQLVGGTPTNGLLATAPSYEVNGSAAPDITGLGGVGIPGGGAVAIWSTEGDPKADDPAPFVQLAVLDEAGLATGLQKTITPDVPSPLRPAVAVAADSRSFAVFDVGTGTPLTGSIVGQQFAADTTALTGILQINSTASGDQSHADVAASGADWYVVWQAPDGDSTGIFGRRVLADGTMPESDAPLSLTKKGKQADPRILAWPDGHALVVWRDGIGIDSRLTGRFFPAL